MTLHSFYSNLIHYIVCRKILHSGRENGWGPSPILYEFTMTLHSFYSNLIQYIVCRKILDSGRENGWGPSPIRARDAGTDAR